MSEATRKRFRLTPARRRALLQTLGVVVAVGLLLWGADTMARRGAETLLERNIQDATGVEVKPEADVRGFFFLPQVIPGVYSEVHVTTEGITSGPLRIDHLESELFDVRVPFHDVLVRDIRRVGIGRSVETFDLTYPDLNAYFATTGRPLTLAPGSDGAVTLSGDVTVLNRRVPVSADVILWVEDDVLRMSPKNLNSGSAALDTLSRLLLRQQLSLIIPLGTLPFGHRLTGVQADADGVHIRTEGSGILLAP